MIKTSAELVAEAKQIINEIDVETLQSKVNENLILIDVREPGEYAQSHIATSVNMPRGVLEMQINQHPAVENADEPLAAIAQSEVYLICRSGARSALAAESLTKMGFKSVYSVAGGMLAWDQLNAD